ncbi:MAG TPA: TetR/AcrR family transcriptional regulator [Streptosporangiaceae bacterium]|nr:TetR/AcrR family transcriptional regulator [Streptosporangiaceae bacterium]
MTETEVRRDMAEAEGQPGTARRPGRPRSEQVDRAIIQAALDLFAETGPSGFCVEAVAARAGVGKATIYRRWPGKEHLLFDALAALKTPLPEPPGLSVREDLIALVSAMCRDFADPRRVRQYGLLLGEGEKYPELMARYKEQVVEPRREVVRSVLRRGVATGELRPDLDVEIAMLALSGSVVARGKHGSDGIDPGFPERVVNELMRGFAAIRET